MDNINEFIEQRYNNYGITWEISLKAAKKHFKKVKQLEKNYWEVRL